MKRGLLVLLCCSALLFVAALCAAPEPAPDLPELALKALELPDTRPFKMGFAYQPYDWSEEAFAATFDFIAKYGDLIVHYSDDGIPWEEASRRTAYPADFRADMERRIRQRRPGQTVVLVVNALGVDRATIAPVWGEANSLDFSNIGKGKTPWAGRTLDDERVIDAFGNHCEYLIDRFEPDYFFYSGEVNASFRSPDAPEYRAFAFFAKAVYRRLKARYPELPVGLEFVLADDDYMREREQVTRELMAVSDVFGVSTYPFVPEAAPAIRGDASKVPANWFARLRKLAGDKPIGIVEAGFNGAPVSYAGRKLPGNESSQDAFVRFMLREAAAGSFAFAAWWVHRDYDLLWEKLKRGGADDAFNQWRTTGLVDGTGLPRRALGTWKRWLELPQRAPGVGPDRGA